jgi:hypothetical protein
MHPSWASFDSLQYSNSAGNDFSSTGIEFIFLSVFTGGKYPRKIIDFSLFEFDI